LTIYDGLGASGVVSFYDGTWKNGGAVASSAAWQDFIYVQSNIASAIVHNFNFTLDSSI